MKLVLLAIAGLVIEVLAYPNGAPTSTCSSMTPNHGSNAQNSESVIRISTVNENCYTANKPLNLQISGGSFKGFLVEARALGGNGNPIGNFTRQNTLAATLDCNSMSASALTHTNENTKSNVKFYWNVPVNPPPQITFRLTVVRDYSTYWLSVNTSLNICQVITDTTATTTTNTSPKPNDTTTPELNLTISKDNSTTTNSQLTTVKSILTCGVAVDHKSCKKMRSQNCYIENSRQLCCNTCNKFKDLYGGNPACLYGDKVRNCSKKKKVPTAPLR